MSCDDGDKGLYLYLSNSLNKLCDKLLINFEKSYKNSSFFESKTIVVQTPGIAKWLSYKISDRLGVCFNVDFLFPKGFVEKTLKSLGILDDNDESFYDKSNIILNVLSQVENSQDSTLVQYAKDNSGKKLGQFVAYIGDLFDQYLTYRPEFIENPNKISTKWQQELFSGIIDNNFTSVSQAIKKFTNNPVDTKKAKPVELFAISFLPPIYVSFFKKLSEYERVNLYVLNPSRDFWFDEPSEKLKLKMQKKLGKDFSKMHFTDSNPILINNGKPIQDFFNLLYGEEPYPTCEIDCYDTNFKDTGIDTLKQKIYKNKPNGFKIKDSTVQIHSHKTKIREVEGVYNYILSILDNNSDIALEDIIVMCPKIDEYAPFIDAVFADSDIAYTISDSIAPKEDEGIKTLFFIADNLNDSFNANDFMELIELEAVKKRFELSGSDIEIVREWIKNINLRWGLNKALIDREFDSMNPFNTFEYGIKRLMLGYLNGDETLIGDVLSYRDVAIAHSELLGKIAYITDRLAHILQKTTSRDSLSNHKKTMDEIIETFIDDSFTQSAIFSALKSELSKYENEEINTAFYTFYEIIKSSINKNRKEFSFLKGGVTFCELVPLRSIPFKVVCLIGMNTEEFPRNMPKISFNEIEQKPRCGDRSSRLNDRLLFLETILSAERYLYISYIGKDIKRNNPLNPSVVVMELMDFVKAEPVEHPLHSFSSRYFDNKNSLLVNYSENDYKLAKSLTLNKSDYDKFSKSEKSEDKEEKNRVKLSKTAKPESEDKHNKIILNELIDFLNHPVKFFFRANSIKLDLKDDTLKDKENVVLDGLESYQIIKSAFKYGKITKELEYSGILPHGSIGNIAKNELSEKLEGLLLNLKKIDQNISFEKLEKLNVAANVESVDIEGEVSFIYDKNTVVSVEYANQKKKDLKMAKILKPLIYFGVLRLSGFDVKSSYFINTAECIKIKTDIAEDALKFAVDIFEKAADVPIVLFGKKYDKHISLEENIQKTIDPYHKTVDDEYNLCLLDNFEFDKEYEKFIYEINDRFIDLHKGALNGI